MARKQREDILIQAFLSYPTITEIAEKTGIARSTVYKYLENSDFKAKLSKAKLEVMQNTVSYLQGSLVDCSKELVEIAKSKNASDQVKINACNSVFANCKALTETTDILQRIQVLEETQEEG